MHMFKAKTLTIVDILFIQKVIADYMSNVYMCSFFLTSYIIYLLTGYEDVSKVYMYFTEEKKLYLTAIYSYSLVNHIRSVIG